MQKHTLMSEELNNINDEAKMEMDMAMEHLEKELSKIRAGKANPSMLNSIMVEYYGVMTPLNQVATISTPDARSLSIKPFEKAILGDVEKAIFAANLGLTPQNDGENVRINIPALTEERRKEMAKMIRAEGENAKISLRNARKSAMDSVKALGKDGMSEDNQKDAEGVIQEITNGYGKKVDVLVKAKEDEVLSI